MDVEAVRAMNFLLGYVEARRYLSTHTSGEQAVQHLETLGYRLVKIEEEDA